MKYFLSFIAVFLLITTILPPAAVGEEENSKGLSKEARKGQSVYDEKGCPACHTIGGGKLSGPDLMGVTQRREEKWLREWIKNPDKMIMTDPIAKEMLKEYYVPMPNQGLTDEEVDEIIIYLKFEDSRNEGAENENESGKQK